MDNSRTSFLHMYNKGRVPIYSIVDIQLVADILPNSIRLNDYSKTQHSTTSTLFKSGFISHLVLSMSLAVDSHFVTYSIWIKSPAVDSHFLTY